MRELRYVLCLLLMRKRRVKVLKVLREDGEESFIVKRPKEDARYKVYVYDFEPERLDEVRAQLQAVFDGAEGPHGIRLSDEDDDGAADVANEGDAEVAGDPDPSSEPGEPEGSAPQEGDPDESGGADGDAESDPPSEPDSPEDELDEE